MTGVRRDLPALLDHTGHALVLGGRDDGVRYELSERRDSPPWVRLADGVDYRYSWSVMVGEAESRGGRVAAVLPPDAPEPPVGSVVRLISPESQGAPQTRTADGWCWVEGDRQYGDAKTWAEMVAFAQQTGMTEELVAVPVIGQQPDAQSEPADHLAGGVNAQSSPGSAVVARQLTEGTDWEAVAEWCGGRMVTPLDNPDPIVAVLVPGREVSVWAWSRRGDWIVRDADGAFAVVPGRHADAILRAHRGGA